MNTKEYRSTLNKLLCDRPIAYHPILAKISGSVIAGIMLSQLLYWTGTRAAQNRGGWIYKSVEEFETETGLSKRNQQTARKNLLAIGLIEAVLKGVPRTWFYKVDFDKIAERIFHWEQSAPNDESETRPILEAVCAQLNRKQEITQKITSDKKINPSFETGKQNGNGITKYRKLSTTFVNETRIPELTGGARSWNESIGEMVKAGVEVVDMESAINILRDKNYSIVRPRSIVNTAISEMSKRKDRDEKGSRSNEPREKRVVKIVLPDGTIGEETV